MAESQNKLRNRRTGRQPITRHPLFPVIVALWFAVLLGFGSFALRTSLIERLVLASHIDALVPAAAPPLGATARLAIAFGFGFVGAVIGFLLAQRLGRPAKSAPHVFKVAEADLDAPLPRVAPAAPPALDPSISAPSAETPAPIEVAVDGPIMLPPVPAVEILPPEPEILKPGTPRSQTVAALPQVEAENVVVETEVAVIAPVAVGSIPVETKVVQPAEVDSIPVFARPAPEHSAADHIAGAELSELSHVELIERLAIALQRRQETRGVEPAEPSAPVLQFPDRADRRGVRPIVAAPRVAPKETERALRDALAALQRMSGG